MIKLNVQSFCKKRIDDENYLLYGTNFLKLTLNLYFYIYSSLRDFWEKKLDPSLIIKTFEEKPKNQKKISNCFNYSQRL